MPPPSGLVWMLTCTWALLHPLVWSGWYFRCFSESMWQSTAQCYWAVAEQLGGGVCPWEAVLTTAVCCKSLSSAPPCLLGLPGSPWDGCSVPAQPPIMGPSAKPASCRLDFEPSNFKSKNLSSLPEETVLGSSS